MGRRVYWHAEPDVLNVRDLARILGTSEKTAREVLASGDIPARKVGAKWLVAKSQVIKYVEGT